MSTVLILVSHFLPGYRAGGLPRAIANLVRRIPNVTFKILTADRDMGDTQSYLDVAVNQWQERVGVQVFYAEPSRLRLRHLRAFLRQTEYGVLYLNGLFDRLTIRVLALRRLGLIPARPVILAPHGVFSAGALAQKPWKKRLYLVLSRLVDLYRDVTWHSTSEIETEEIRTHLGKEIFLIEASNIPQPPPVTVLEDHAAKVIGQLRVIFLSRISPKKNLIQAIKLVSKLSVDTTFDIYGPIEDTQYWQRCCDLINHVPGNIRVHHCGDARPEDVVGVMGQYDVFLLPTLGENYGYVIAEALSAATPVLISDNTPWRGLEQLNAGWDLSLSEPERFIACLERVAAMDEGQHQRWRRGAYQLACTRTISTEVIEAYQTLFSSAHDHTFRVRK